MVGEVLTRHFSGQCTYVEVHHYGGSQAFSTHESMQGIQRAQDSQLLTNANLSEKLFGSVI